MSDHALRLDNQVCFPLYAAARAMMKAYQPLLAKLGLTYPQYLVLLVLWEEDGLSVTAIGERLYLDSGTLTPLLKRLEESNLVRRRRGRGDERVVEISLTATGKQMKRRAQQVPQALLCQLALPLDELFRLRDDMRRLYTSIRASNEQRQEESHGP
jgi:DNA-binding MarR family transcriptional regulator